MLKLDLKKYLSVAEGFQYSVNVGFDINNDDKIKSFIPTTASLEIIEDLILSTAENSTDRARILIGAYGKGKSHIILVLLSLLTRKEPELFSALLPKIKAYSENLYNYVINYLKSDVKLLPVIIQGNYASLTQSFLGAMQRALEVEGLEDFMPETQFKAALEKIEDWRKNYVDTYNKFISMLNQPIGDFLLRLSEFDVEAYEQFVDLYPALTSGSTFNPFMGLNVIDLYTTVVEKLQTKGYHGVFVLYDEFSKFLEAEITKVSLVDIKLLQDFAEKCNRSKDKQMHLLLISHKDISNYIDKLPKQKVDGWRGVSERFKHMELHNNISQVYELIATVIKQNPEYIDKLFGQYSAKFEDILNYISQTNMFSELDAEQLNTIIYGCYPLHPISTFILPRLSEKIAQNERTLFTFLASKNKNTLTSFIDNAEGEFPMLTPDYIYDFFEPLLKKEPYTSDIHKIYLLTTNILARLSPGTLEIKIVKTIALIYIVGQFEKLPPTPDVIINTFREYVNDLSEISTALQQLQNKQYVVYLKKSNNYLRLKNSIAFNVGNKITDMAEKIKSTQRVKDILNNALIDNYMYPTNYNDDYNITRYFDFDFIEGSEFFDVDNWEKKISSFDGDGVVFGIIPKDDEEIKEIKDAITRAKCHHQRIVFILPLQSYEIDQVAYEYQAVKQLKEQNNDDDVMVEELNIYIEDMEEVIEQFVLSYTRPELRKVEYYYNGKKQPLFRKTQVSQLLSNICKEIYTDTPVINNEAINKDYLPPVAINSRTKVIAGLLSNRLLTNLGLTGTGQDISIMRSTLVMTGILTDIAIQPKLIISGNSNKKIQNVLDVISNFIKTTSDNKVANLKDLYDILIKPEYHIGLKKGVIPIYIAVVLHFYKHHIVIMRGNKELEINADLLNSINENPGEYYIYLEDWNDEKADYIATLEEIFKDEIYPFEKEYNNFSYIVRAIQRWFMKLPSYAKEMKELYIGNGEFKKIETEKLRFINSLKFPEINAHEYIFKKVLLFFGYTTISPNVVGDIREVKALYDGAKENLIKALINDVRLEFESCKLNKSSLSSIIKDWYEELDDKTKNYLFTNGENRVLELMRTINGDDKLFIERLAKALTGLRIDDWNDKSINLFRDELRRFKNTVENQNKGFTAISMQRTTNIYKIIFVDESGNEHIKTFNRIEYSNTAKLLINEIKTALEEYGQAISEGEKRQVVMEILEELC